METRIEHIAIIMDGNRRWAQKRDLTASDGHRAGTESLIKVVRHAAKLDIKFLTVYALSTENFSQRSKSELAGLFKILQEKLQEHLPELRKEGIRLEILGDISSLPGPVSDSVKKAVSALSGSRKAQINVALNYGAREEIVRAASAAIKKKISPGELTEKTFGELLFTKNIPDPEILIRTGGQKRLSNFLLWQLAYTELFFSQTLWPDFGTDELDRVIEEFLERKRNFGR